VFWPMAVANRTLLANTWAFFVFGYFLFFFGKKTNHWPDYA
jgi:hypothetical protein